MKDLRAFLHPLREKLQSLVLNKKILIIMGGCTAGFILLLSLLVISIRINHNQNEIQKASQELYRSFNPQTIESEDIFLPREPDFLPEVILDRKPRYSWIDEDAKQFWVDPLSENTETWKNRVFKAVDEMLENVP